MDTGDAPRWSLRLDETLFFIDRPALIFWGMQDPGFPRIDLERFERAFPNHKTIELANANHFFFEDAGQQMIKEIGAFVSGDSLRHRSRREQP